MQYALFWSGDILTLYALLVFFARPQALVLYFGPEMPPASELAHKVYPDLAPQEVASALGSGSWSEVFVVNLHNLYWRWLDFLPNGRISRVLGFFILGFYLARSGYFIHQVNKARWVSPSCGCLPWRSIQGRCCSAACGCNSSGRAPSSGCGAA